VRKKQPRMPVMVRVANAATSQFPVVTVKMKKARAIDEGTACM